MPTSVQENTRTHVAMELRELRGKQFWEDIYGEDDRPRVGKLICKKEGHFNIQTNEGLRAALKHLESQIQIEVRMKKIQISRNTLRFH
jgi:hypothetical protein